MINLTNIIFILVLACAIIYLNKDVIKEGFAGTTKIAFIFLTIGEVKQHQIWEKFLKGNENRYSIYIHPKNPNDIKSFFKDYIISNRVPTKWGHYSLVEATNVLIGEALKNHNNKKIVLVSDSCIPIKSFDNIYKQLTDDNKSWFNYYKPDLKMGSKIHLERLLNLHPKFKPHGYIQEQWMVLSQDHAKLVYKNKNALEYFKTPKLVPDELFYITLLHYLLQNKDKQLKHPITNRTEYLQHKTVTYAKWYDPIIKKWTIHHPYEYDKMKKHDLLAMKKTNALFARKFSAESNIGKYWDFLIK